MGGARKGVRRHGVAGVVLALAFFAAAPAGASASRILFDLGGQHPGSRVRNRLWVMRPDGGGKHRLATPPNVGGGEFSRNGRTLVWELDPTRSGATRWYRGDRNGRHAKLVFKRRNAGGTLVSPSGGKLEFAEEHGGNVSAGIVNLRTRHVRVFGGLGPGGWAPDGRHVVALGAEIASSCVPIPIIGQLPCPPSQWPLYDLDTTTGATRTIATFTGEGPGGATWSHNGRLIAFVRAAASGAPPQLFVIKPDGTGLRQVTNLPYGSGEAVFSPDDSRFAILVRTSKPGKSYIASIRQDGSGLRRLTRDKYSLSLSAWGR